MIDHDLLQSLARPAVDLSLSFASQRASMGVTEKAAHDFVSEADQAVERAIRSSLADQFGSAFVIGEEQGGSLDDFQTGWAIDPIDGTSNFLRGLPMWGISIGRIERGKPTHGIIVLPELGLSLTGIHGQGARCNGALLSVPRTPSPIKTLALGENNFEPGAVTDRRAERARKRGFDVVRYRCASFSLASVALNRLDAYIENGCCLWDIAAGWIICEESGVRVDVEIVAEDHRAILARWPWHNGFEILDCEC